MREFARAYGAPLWLAAIFAAVLLAFWVTPDPSSAELQAEPTSEPTPGPRECVVCPIDQRCDPGSGQCMFIDHTPLPCVKSAKYDDEAGYCLPTGAPPAPAVTTAQPGTIPGPQFPGGIGGRVPRQPRGADSGPSIGD
jgi:hypothetical protein